MGLQVDFFLPSLYLNYSRPPRSITLVSGGGFTDSSKHAPSLIPITRLTRPPRLSSLPPRPPIPRLSYFKGRQIPSTWKGNACKLRIGGLACRASTASLCSSWFPLPAPPRTQCSPSPHCSLSSPWFCKCSCCCLEYSPCQCVGPNPTCPGSRIPGIPSWGAEPPVTPFP